MIQDPADEVLTTVRRAGDDPSAADRAALALVRRRFGLSLPLPFAALPPAGEPVPVRRALAEDGPAIAATKWRSWRVAYRGIVPDDFLARLGVHPPASYWTGRAAVPPSRRHAVLVAGRPGSVLGLAAVDPDEEDPDRVQLKVLYVDPLAQRRGLGRALVGAVLDHARAVGATGALLWVAAANGTARAFYEAMGWRADGGHLRFELEPGVAMDEVRYGFTGVIAP